MAMSNPNRNINIGEKFISNSNQFISNSKKDISNPLSKLIKKISVCINNCINIDNEIKKLYALSDKPLQNGNKSENNYNNLNKNPIRKKDTDPVNQIAQSEQNDDLHLQFEDQNPVNILTQIDINTTLTTPTTTTTTPTPLQQVIDEFIKKVISLSIVSHDDIFTSYFYFPFNKSNKSYIIYLNRKIIIYLNRKIYDIQNSHSFSTTNNSTKTGFTPYHPKLKPIQSFKTNLL